MARHPSAALRVVLAWLLAAGPVPSIAGTPAAPPDLDFSSIFSPAQSLMIRALNSDRKFLDAFYPEFEKSQKDQAAGQAGAVQAFAEKWRAVISQRAAEALAVDPADRSRSNPTALSGLEKSVFDVLYLEADVKAHTRDVPPRTLGTPEGDPLRDAEIIARNRVAVRGFLAYVAAQPPGALGSGEKDWEAVRKAMADSNKPGSLKDVQGWLSASAPKASEPVPTPEPKKQDFAKVFGPEAGDAMYARFQEELKALDPKASDHQARRRRIIEEWQGRLNKGPLDARIGLAFQSPVERALASYLAKDWDGKTGPEAEAAFSAVLDKAISGDAASRSAIVSRARAALTAHLKKDTDPPGLKEVLSGKGVQRDALLAFYCSTAQEAPPASGDAAAKTARGQGELARDRAADARESAESGSRAADFTTKEDGTPVPAAAPSDMDPALAEECKQWRDADVARRENERERERQRRTNIAGDSVPPVTGAQERPGTAPDKEDGSKAKADAEAAAKKKDLQRMAIGGMGGAIVLGVFGFIFGGPIGAIALGAVGFGIMAGVTYLNNHPIK